MRSLLLALVVFLPFPCVTAQDQVKEDITRGVFDRLVAARGDLRRPAPDFVLSPRKAYAASADGRTITLEEAAFDVCAALPGDTVTALAGLLAHELIHYYEGHEWEDGFVALVAPPVGVDALVRETSEDLTRDEIEADYQGGFLAQLAGYPSTGTMPDVLAAVYAAYGLPDTLAGYPPLAERRRIATQTARRLEKLTRAFETANLLAATGFYDAAADSYRSLAEEFPSRELYNNNGVLHALAAIQRFPPGTLPYTYPFELDLDSRMRTGTRSVTAERAQREALLETALEQWERAETLDREYTTARLNRATGLSLLAHSLQQVPVQPGNAERAEDLLLEAQLLLRKLRRSDTADSSAVESLSTIIANQLSGEPAVAATPIPEVSSGDAFALRETIDGYTMDELLQRGIATGDRRYLEYRSPGRRVTFVRAADDARTALEIGRASTGREVEREYGSPDSRLATAGGGALLVYGESELVFELSNGRVRHWYLFREGR